MFFENKINGGEPMSLQNALGIKSIQIKQSKIKQSKKTNDCK